MVIATIIENDHEDNDDDDDVVDDEKAMLIRRTDRCNKIYVHSFIKTYEVG